MSTQEKQVLFKLRTRSFDCKANYPNKFNSLQCDFCEQIDYQDHLLDCIASTEGLNTQGIKYSDIFGNIAQQIKVAKVMRQIADKRKSLHNTPSSHRKPGASSQMPHMQ